MEELIWGAWHTCPVQVCILDGNKYTSRCREMGEQRQDILDECEVRQAPRALHDLECLPVGRPIEMHLS